MWSKSKLKHILCVVLVIYYFSNVCDSAALKHKQVQNKHNEPDKIDKLEHELGDDAQDKMDERGNVFYSNEEEEEEGGPNDKGPIDEVKVDNKVGQIHDTQNVPKPDAVPNEDFKLDNHEKEDPQPENIVKNEVDNKISDIPIPDGKVPQVKNKFQQQHVEDKDSKKYKMFKEKNKAHRNERFRGNDVIDQHGEHDSEEDVGGMADQLDRPFKPLPLVKGHSKVDAVLLARGNKNSHHEILEDIDEDDGHPLKFPERRHGFKLDDIQVPDHLGGVRMEQDGHLNTDYKKEVFLGHFEHSYDEPIDQIRKELMKVFYKADTNKDSYLTVDELRKWIVLQVREHFKEGERESKKLFKGLDEDSDGYVTWNDYFLSYMIALGFTQKQAEKYLGREGDLHIDVAEKDRLLHHKQLWEEADENPKDGKLNAEEFMAFKHPEQSKPMLERIVQDILDSLDKNKDSILSEKEFIALPPGDEDSRYQEQDKAWLDERKKEFRKIIDRNRDGKVDRKELMAYVDPQNPTHAKQEAESLIEMADDDNDKKLSLDEVLDNVQVFMDSKVLHTGLNLHEEL